MRQILDRLRHTIVRGFIDVVPLGAVSWLLAALAALIVLELALPARARGRRWLALATCAAGAAAGGAIATLCGFGGTMDWDPRSALLALVCALAAGTWLASRTVKRAARAA